MNIDEIKERAAAMKSKADDGEYRIDGPVSDVMFRVASDFVDALMMIDDLVARLMEARILVDLATKTEADHHIDYPYARFVLRVIDGTAPPKESDK